MNRTFLFLVLIAMLVLPKEAHVSQVFREEQKGSSLKEAITSPAPEFDHILVIKGPLATKVFRTVIFPKETHYKKEAETPYNEYVGEYEIDEVLKSDKFKKGDKFWEWSAPAYNLDSIKMYHEDGILDSPIEVSRKPQYPFIGNEFIAFLKKSEKSTKEFPEVYLIAFKEGLGAKKEIRGLLRNAAPAPDKKNPTGKPDNGNSGNTVTPPGK